MASVYSVSDINRYIKNMFDQDFLLNKISVRGEISNLKYHSSGHIYFTLKDNQGSIAGIMYAGNRNGLNFKLCDGMKVICTGSVIVYEAMGKYQIRALTFEKEGEGDLYKKFLALKQELEEMGMFDESYKKEIPYYCEKIGIVTANQSTAAAINDIVSVAKRRNPFVQLYYYPAIVQGEKAKYSIVKGIEILDRLDLDVIIVGRGGGSIEDLWAFNEEMVARAIFSCNTPVVSAVGHEIDFTISDFVADKRAATPSAAAEICVRPIDEIVQKIDGYQSRLQKSITSHIDNNKRKIDSYSKSLSLLSPVNTINNKKVLIESYAEKLNLLINTRIETAKHKLELFDNRITVGFNKTIEGKKNKFVMLSDKLDNLSPLKRISSGYSYLEDIDGNGIKSINQVKKDDTIKSSLKDGIIISKVIEIEDKISYKVEK